MRSGENFEGVMNLNPETKQQRNNGKLELTCLQTNTSTESVVDLEAIHNDKMPVLGELLRYKGGHVPGMEGYKWSLERGQGMATYEVRDGRAKILSGVVVWKSDAQTRAWEIAQKAAGEVGMIPVVVANDDMRTELRVLPEKPEQLPWMASSLSSGALRAAREKGAPVFSLAFQSPEGLVMTAPVVAATTRSLLDLANFEMLLACAILAQTHNGQLGRA
jgi:hypothetical protein